jgi:hypothetical protein
MCNLMSKRHRQIPYAAILIPLTCSDSRESFTCAHPWRGLTSSTAIKRADNYSFVSYYNWEISFDFRPFSLGIELFSAQKKRPEPVGAFF